MMFSAAPWHDHGHHHHHPIQIPPDIKKRILEALYVCDIV
jgi:hypothetical protein